MYRILVADDEPIAVESYVYIINKNFSDASVVGTSRTGKDAIEKAYGLRPDIILMDINMPGINGLEAIKQIRDANPNVWVIVISAFDYFDYAVEAVALGVFEYLLKPVKEQRLVETLSKAMEEVDKNKKLMQKTLEQQEKLEIILPILETGFINSLCLFSDSTRELLQYCQLFGYDHSSGYVMVIEFGEKVSNAIENKIGAGVQGEKMYGEFKKILKSLYSCIVGPVMVNRIIVYVFEEAEEDVFMQKTRSVDLAQTFLRRAAKFYTDIYIGIGRYRGNVEEGKKSYQEALHALRIITTSEEEEETNQIRILHVDDIMTSSEVENDYRHQIETEIHGSIGEKDDAKVKSSFHHIFYTMVQDSNMDMSGLKRHMIGLVVGLVTRWENASDHYSEVINQIIGAADNEALYHICSKYLEEVVEQIISGRQKKVNSIIQKANAYIKENYHRELSLEEVAKEVNLSSYYFSRFYKDETGVNFTDMLANVRIDRAKELLKEEYSVKDVCYMVGYMEPNYFSKIFKKITGYTASEYKKIYGV